MALVVVLSSEKKSEGTRKKKKELPGERVEKCDGRSVQEQILAGELSFLSKRQLNIPDYATD